MHQGHNIPWLTFEKHFTFVIEDKRYTPPFTGLLYKESPTAVKELQHFVRKFAATIKEFSETERKKYPAKVPLISPTDKVFSDALRDKYPEHLNERFQTLSSWIAYVKHPYSYGYLREAIMVLLFENEMETLLMLAHHPQFKMAHIVKARCGDYYSARGEESAIYSYLFFNIMDAVGQLSNGGYARTMQFRSLIDYLNTGRHYCGQYVAHEMLPKDLLVHKNLEALQEYLKRLFAVMYRYDVLAREVGVDPRWEHNILLGGLPANAATTEYSETYFRALNASIDSRVL